MDTVKIGIIGIGAVALAAHIPAFHQDKRVEVVALCDIDRKRALNAKKKYFKNAAVYEDYMELLADDEVDAVDICVPNYLHAEIVAEAFRAGKHVLCESPDAVSVEEAEKMYAASLDTEKVYAVMRNGRYNENAQYLKKYIEKERLGEIYAIRVVDRKRRGVPGAGSWRTSKELAGGGALMEAGFPLLDLAWSFMDYPEVDTVSADTFRKISEVEDVNGEFDVEELALGTVKFKNGAVLQFDIGWAANIDRNERYLQFYGTKAGAYWDGSKNEIYYEAPKGKQKNHLVNNNDIIPDTTLNITSFIDAILGKADLSDTPKQGIELLKIVSALYESAANDGKQVKFAQERDQIIQ